jgi:predicted ATPase
MGAHRLKDLSQPECVWQLLHPDLPTDFPPLQSLSVLLHNLSIQNTSIVGREAELVEIERRLSRARLLTLTGAGGVGKSRLALQVGADLLEAYLDGVWLVELAPISDPALVPLVVASVLGMGGEQPERNLTQSMASAIRAKEETGLSLIRARSVHLKPKSLLLVLDQCKHLRSVCAGLVNALLTTCPNLRVLATSRKPLNVPGEMTYTIYP